MGLYTAIKYKLASLKAITCLSREIDNVNEDCR